MIVREDCIDKETSPREEVEAMENVDLPLTVARSSRTILNHNIEPSIEAITLGATDVSGRRGSADSNQMDTVPTTNAESSITKGYITSIKESIIESSSDSEMNTIDTDGNEETSPGLSEPSSAMKFQPLQPISEKSLSPSEHIPNIENSAVQDQKASQPYSVIHSKESGSFMNNIQDPVAASKVFKKSQAENETSQSTQLMSHTPPTSMSTSYETMHFGKRPRSGVSSFRNQEHFVVQ